MKLTRLFLQAVVGAFRLLPLSFAVALGRFIGWLLYVFRFRRRIIELQMKKTICRRYPEVELDRLVRDHLTHFGLLFVEMLRLPGTTEEQYRRLVPGESVGIENLDKALAKGKGVMILGAHIGNWEIGMSYLIRQGYDVSVITKEVKGRIGEAMRVMLRDDTGLKSIPRRNSIKQIFRTLKENKIIVVVVDQNATSKEAEFVDFFDYPAATLPALVVLAARTGATIIPASAYRNADLRTHRNQYWPEIELENPYDDKHKNLIHNLQRLSHMAEQMIEAEPHQWIWLHKRWRTRPEGEKEPPFDYKKRR